MYAISYLVGRKYGTWALGRRRFATSDRAQDALEIADRAERRAGATRIWKRVVRVDQ